MQAVELSASLHTLAEETELSRRYAYEVDDIKYRLILGWAQSAGYGGITDNAERETTLRRWINDNFAEVAEHVLGTRPLIPREGG